MWCLSAREVRPLRTMLALVLSLWPIKAGHEQRLLRIPTHVLMESPRIKLSISFGKLKNFVLKNVKPWHATAAHLRLFQHWPIFASYFKAEFVYFQVAVMELSFYIFQRHSKLPPQSSEVLLPSQMSPLSFLCREQEVLSHRNPHVAQHCLLGLQLRLWFSFGLSPVALHP